jgi:glucose-6-phosphate isomerase
MLIAENNETTITASVAGISFFFARNASLTEFNQDHFNAYLQRLFSGDIVNESEQRAAWHTEFRNPRPCQLVKDSLEQIRHISDSVRKKQWFFDVTDVVNIGIGGSDLGPQLLCEAFADVIDGPRVHFVSNLDLTQINLLLKKLSPQNTLFVITSKSFRTLETLENMHVAKQWFLDANVDPSQHLIAIHLLQLNRIKFRNRMFYLFLNGWVDVIRFGLRLGYRAQSHLVSKNFMRCIKVRMKWISIFCGHLSKITNRCSMH